MTQAVGLERMRMKIDPRLFAVLAVGVLSASTAFAGHHSHYHAHVAAAHASSHDIKTSAKTGASTETAPETVKTDGSAETAPAEDRAHRHATTPGVGPSSKEGSAETPLDTTITVNQGPASIKHAKTRLGKKTKTAYTTKTAKTTKTTGALGVVLKHQYVFNHRQKPSVGLGGNLQRNAVGALVEHKTDHDKTIEHSTTVVPGVTARTTGPVTPNLVTKAVNGNATIDKSRPDANKIVRTSGLSISGTGSFRTKFDTGALGGPAQINSGVLSGNMFHPKHP